MSDFSVHEFQINTNDPNGRPGPWKMTSVVVSESEYNAFVDYMLEKVVGVLSQSGRIERDQIEALRGARHITMIARGTRTESLFTRYKVKTDFMAIIVRGEGERMIQALIPSGAPN